MTAELVLKGLSSGCGLRRFGVVLSLLNEHVVHAALAGSHKLYVPGRSHAHPFTASPAARARADRRVGLELMLASPLVNEPSAKGNLGRQLGMEPHVAWSSTCFLCRRLLGSLAAVGSMAHWKPR